MLFCNVHECPRTCRLNRTCMYIVQVDPHEHVCEHGSWCLAFQGSGSAEGRAGGVRAGGSRERRAGGVRAGGWGEGRAGGVRAGAGSGKGRTGGVRAGGSGEGRAGGVSTTGVSTKHDRAEYDRGGTRNNLKQDRGEYQAFLEASSHRRQSDGVLGCTRRPR